MQDILTYEKKTKIYGYYLHEGDARIITDKLSFIGDCSKKLQNKSCDYDIALSNSIDSSLRIKNLFDRVLQQFKDKKLTTSQLKDVNEQLKVELLEQNYNSLTIYDKGVELHKSFGEFKKEVKDLNYYLNGVKLRRPKIYNFIANGFSEYKFDIFLGFFLIPFNIFIFPFNIVLKYFLKKIFKKYFKDRISIFFLEILRDHIIIPQFNNSLKENSKENSVEIFKENSEETFKENLKKIRKRLF